MKMSVSKMIRQRIRSGLLSIEFQRDVVGEAVSKTLFRKEVMDLSDFKLHMLEKMIESEVQRVVDMIHLIDNPGDSKMIRVTTRKRAKRRP